jgi:CMP-N,N'-diacetyllegionaminic acid synthase
VVLLYVGDSEAQGNSSVIPMRILAVIPARGGSRGILNKNIKPVAGKPLLAWTIEAALGSRSLARVIVSTDDLEISEVAHRHSAEVPFLRPAGLAQDDTPGIEPVLHAARWLDEHEGYRPDYLMVLQPTSPLRSTKDIEAAAQLARDRQADGVVSVCPAPQHPYWMKSIGEDGRLVDFLSVSEAYTRRQDLPPAYALNGAIYLVRRRVFLEQRTFYTDRTYAYVMPPERSLDIDTAWDLYLADLILRERNHHEAD